MKKNYLLSMILAVALVGGMVHADNTERIPSVKPLCSEKVCGKHTKKCSCYCSVLCGPRKIQPDDAPVFASEDSNGQEIPARCYCKQMDVDEHIKNCINKKQEEASEDQE